MIIQYLTMSFKYPRGTRTPPQLRTTALYLENCEPISATELTGVVHLLTVPSCQKHSDLVGIPFT